MNIKECITKLEKVIPPKSKLSIKSIETKFYNPPMRGYKDTIKCEVFFDGVLKVKLNLIFASRKIKYPELNFHAPPVTKFSGDILSATIKFMDTYENQVKNLLQPTIDAFNIERGV